MAVLYNQPVPRHCHFSLTRPSSPIMQIDLVLVSGKLWVNVIVEAIDSVPDILRNKRVAKEKTHNLNEKNIMPVQILG